MDDLNFKHCPSKKSYVINAHEREDVRIDSKKHILRNEELELNEPCWIQFSIKNLKQTLNQQNIPRTRQETLYEKGCMSNETIEFHVDDDPCF